MKILLTGGSKFLGSRVLPLLLATGHDVDNQPIDFVFFDAAHELDLNQSTFEKIRPALAPDAIIAIHDTGTWARNHFGESNKRFAEKSSAG